jgi:hypothetical protein
MPRKSPFDMDLSSEERLSLESMARKYTSPYFDDQLVQTLVGIANRIDAEIPGQTADFVDSFEHLRQTVRAEALTADLQTFLTLSRNVESVTNSLNKEI